MPTLEYLLEQSRLSIAEIASASGLDEERVEKIVAGRWTPSPAERAAIAVAFGVEVKEIAFGHNMNARNIRFHRFGLREDFDGRRSMESGSSS